VLVERVRQGRHHHLGDPGDRLPLGRPRPPRVRAARLPARRGLLLVHLLAHARALPVRARRARRDVPRSQSAPRRSGRRVGRGRHRPREAPPLPVRARQGRTGAHQLGRGGRDRRRRPRARHRRVRARPHRRIQPDPGDVAGLPRRGRAVREPPRRLDALVLRLVRGPARRVPAGLRRPDRRARVGRLVGRRVPHAVGVERPRHADPGRALDGRGPLPGPEGRHRRPRLQRRREVRRRMARPAPGHGRRAGHGDGARDPQGALRGRAHGGLRRLRAQVHRPAVPGRARRARRGPGAGQVPAPRRPAGRGAVRRVEAGLHRRAHRRGPRPARDPRPPLGRGAAGQLEPRSGRRGAAAQLLRGRR
jgi:hypothetical protein